MPEGIYHEKIGILKDTEGNIVYFSGSANATVSGLKRNWENILVLTSWTGDADLTNKQCLYFDELWSNSVADLEVIDFPEAEKRELLIKSAQIPIMLFESSRIIIEKILRRRSSMTTKELLSTNLSITTDVIFLRWQLERAKHLLQYVQSKN